MIAAATEDAGPALFIVESKTTGLLCGRAGDRRSRRRHRQLNLDGVRVPAGALLAEGNAKTYAECIRLSRIAWARCRSAPRRARSTS